MDDIFRAGMSGMKPAREREYGHGTADLRMRSDEL